MRISDWSSDVCSSDLERRARGPGEEKQDKQSEGDRQLRTSNIVSDKLHGGFPSHQDATEPRPEGSSPIVPLPDKRPPALQLDSGPPATHFLSPVGRSEERRVGKEFFSTFTSVCSPSH